MSDEMNPDVGPELGSRPSIYESMMRHSTEVRFQAHHDGVGIYLLSHSVIPPTREQLVQDWMRVEVLEFRRDAEGRMVRDDRGAPVPSRQYYPTREEAEAHVPAEWDASVDRVYGTTRSQPKKQEAA